MTPKNPKAPAKPRLSENKTSALVFANGRITAREINLIRKQKFDAIIAADGGAAAALKYGFTPDYVVGDLDSVTEDIRTRLLQTRFVSRPSQEQNDLEKTLRFCAEKGVARMTLLGISGKRLDHTLNNLSVLCRYDQKFEMSIYTGYSRVFIVRSQFVWDGPPGRLISLIPLGTVAGVRTEGLAFPLRDEDLIFGQREGLSNYINIPPVKISISSGILLVFVSYSEQGR